MSDVTQRPTGTVTFLFTDLEGSTHLWETETRAMERALARHDAVLREVFERHGGYVFAQGGDGYAAAFADPGAALLSALEIQLALRREVWPQGIELRARMGLHTGNAQERDGNFFGPAVNFVARLTDAGHGGQVLVSEATAALLTDTDVRLRLLGAYRLRGLERPRPVYQFLHADLTETFPPLRAEEGAATNLPAPHGPVIGREAELGELAGLLGKNQVVTITGAGGVGKTTLAIEVARRARQGYPNGSWFVDLARLADSRLVDRELAEAVGVANRNQEWRDAALAALRGDKALIVLDNCEHVIDAVSDLVEEIVTNCSDVTVLATSREALGLSGEKVWRVPSLAPDKAADLFRHRAELASGLGESTPADATLIAEICRRLDYVPLAVELAGARTRHLSLAEISARLDDRFTLLTGGSRTALPRQRTLEATVSWSYDLLDRDEQRALQWLSTCPGGFTLAAAEAICGPGAFGRVISLAEKSLLVVEPTGESTRYRMLETIRAFARDRLAQGDDAVRARDAQLTWATGLAREARRRFRNDDAGALEMVETELDNLRAAMQWGLGHGDVSRGLYIASSLFEYWDARAIREGRDWYDRFLAVADDTVDPAILAWGLLFAGTIALRVGDRALAGQRIQHAYRLHDQLHNDEGAAMALMFEGVLKDDPHALSRSRDVFRSVGSDKLLAANLAYSIAPALRAGEIEHARSLIDELDSVAGRLHLARHHAHALEYRARLLLREGDLRSPAHLLAEALDRYASLGIQVCTMHCVRSAAEWAFRNGRADTAAVLGGAADRAIVDYGWASVEDLPGDALEAIRRERADDWQTGYELCLDEAVAMARSTLRTVAG